MGKQFEEEPASDSELPNELRAHEKNQKFIHGKLTVEFWTIDSKIAISRNIGLRPIKHNEKLFRISKLTIDILVTFVFRDILIKYFSILKNSLLKIRFKTA